MGQKNEDISKSVNSIDSGLIFLPWLGQDLSRNTSVVSNPFPGRKFWTRKDFFRDTKNAQILSFSKLLNQKAIHKPSAQHVLDDDYYRRIEAIQFTMAHDDGKKIDDIESADVILLGVSRTSKTPTSIYLANRGFKTINIPLVLDQKFPQNLSQNTKACVIGLIADPERLADIRRNRVAIMNERQIKDYTDLEFIKKEVSESKKLFKKNNWPAIDVTRRSVEETAASILKIIEIKKNRWK